MAVTIRESADTLGGTARNNDSCLHTITLSLKVARKTLQHHAHLMPENLLAMIYITYANNQIDGTLVRC